MSKKSIKSPLLSHIIGWPSCPITMLVLFHRGGKMSSSIPASHISLLDAPEEGYDKVKSATTGGRDTAEEQRELGGEADKCPVYELYAYLLTGDDDELAKEVYDAHIAYMTEIGLLK